MATPPACHRRSYRGPMRIPPVPGPRDVLTLASRAGEAVDALLAVVPRAARLLSDAEQLLAEVGALVGRIEETRRTAQEVADRTEVTVERVTGLIGSLEPSLTALQPTLERLADTTAPAEVDALVGLIDQLPRLAAQLDDVLPVLGTMSSVAPDLRDLLDTSRELNLLLARAPGFGRIRRRVEDRQTAAEDEVGG